MKLAAFFIPVIAVASACAPLCAQSTTLAIIAKTGDQLAALPPNSALTGLFDAAVLNNSGACLFWARLQGEHVTPDNNAIFLTGQPDQLALLARKGSQAPGLRSGATFNFDYFPWTPVLTDSGTVVFNSFIANLGGDPAEDNATFSGAPGSLSPIAFSGAFAPPTWDRYFKTLNYPNANDIGEAVFKARIVPIGDPGNYFEGIWVGQPGRYRGSLITDTPAPFIPGDLINTVSTDPAIDRFGRILVPITLRGSDVTYYTSQALYFGLPDNLSLVFRSGVTQVPGMPAGATWFPIQNAVTNDHGSIAFTGFARGPGVTPNTDQGIWAGSPANLQLLAREGNSADGLPSSWTLGSLPVSNAPFDGPTIDNAGNVYFGAVASTAVEPESGAGPWLFIAGPTHPQSPRLLLGATQQPVNLGSGAFVNSAQLIATNDSGMVLSYALLAGHRVTETNDRALVVSHASGWNVLVARTGDLVEFAPQDFRHIESIHIEMFQGPGQGGPAGGHDGRPRVLNNAGEVIFIADFIEGGNAVMLAHVYCPADFNHDSVTDFFDYLDFVTAFGSADPAADFNADGVTDFFDYLDFVQAFSAGC